MILINMHRQTILSIEMFIAYVTFISKMTWEMNSFYMFLYVTFLDAFFSTNLTDKHSSGRIFLDITIQHCRIPWSNWNISQFIHFQALLWVLETWAYKLFLALKLLPQNLHSYENKSGKWTLSICFTKFTFWALSFPQIVHLQARVWSDLPM